MKLEDSSNPMLTPTNSSPPTLHLSKSQTNSKLTRQTSSASNTQRRRHYMAHQRRQNLASTNNELLVQHTPSTFSAPLLTGAMHDFFQATKIMEDEIMLPSRLRDMPVDEVVLDNAVQPNNWHELYGFVRDTRNQLTRTRPFADQENPLESIENKDSNDDEGILLASHDNAVNSSASSTVSSSDELERSTISSSNICSFETIKDELKHHYFGLLASLDNLTTMANRVTEKYREDSTFKISK